MDIPLAEEVRGAVFVYILDWIRLPLGVKNRVAILMASEPINFMRYGGVFECYL